MRLSTVCDHTHRVQLEFTEEDGVFVPSPTGRGEVLLLSARVSHENRDPATPERFNGKGVYLKSDGSPSKKSADVRWGKFKDLPQIVQDQVTQALYDNRH